MRRTEVEQPLRVPLRDELERVVRRMLGADALHVRIEVPGADEKRAVGVALGRDRTHERGGARRRDHEHLLAGLDVRADLDDQPGVPVE